MAKKTLDMDNIMFSGLYPPIHDRNLTPDRWYANYIRTYIERDVRQLVNVRDLSTFQRFLRLCAGRIVQLTNLSELANDCGITHNTARSWLSILEASYIVFLLPPHHENFNKRLIKTPKLYFYDSGLAARLLSIQNTEQLNIHPLRGALFESFIISELFKSRFNNGKESNLFFWRDRSGNEVDLIVDNGLTLKPIEIKSGKTLNKDFYKSLIKWLALAGRKAADPVLIYGGNEAVTQKNIRCLSWLDEALSSL